MVKNKLNVKEIIERVEENTNNKLMNGEMQIVEWVNTRGISKRERKNKEKYRKKEMKHQKEK